MDRPCPWPPAAERHRARHGLQRQPNHGEQELGVWNGHFECTRYHPLFVFNQFGDLERCALRASNVHSADGWKDVLDPVVTRYRGKVSRIYFRVDAAFATPGGYEYLEDTRIKYAIRLPANRVLQQRSVIYSSARSGVRRTMSGGLTQASAIRLEAGPSHAGGRQGRVAPWRACPASWLHRDQPRPPGRAGGRLLQPTRHGGTMDKRGQGRDQVDAAVVPVVPTPSGYSFTRSPTISAISFARWGRPSRSRTGR